MANDSDITVKLNSDGSLTIGVPPRVVTEYQARLKFMSFEDAVLDLQTEIGYALQKSIVL